MRITCPNCNAHYEVGEDMIPAEGRDVQCSNCGTTWFQEGRPRVASAVEERAIRRPGRKAPPDENEDEDEEAEADDAAQAPTAAARGGKPRRPEPDQATLDILREERELEERLRAATEGAAETPPSTDQDDVAEDHVAEDEETAAAPPPADPREQAASERARMAAAASLARARDGGRGPRASRTAEAEPVVEVDLSDVVAETMRDAATPTTEDEAVAPGDDPFDGTDMTDPVSARSARRELLPDIEEINSSLRPDERAAEAEAEAAAQAEAPRVAQRSSGFRIGFLLVCLVIALLIGVYVFAAQIGAAVPQVADMLEGYVAWVDAQRVTLAAAAEALTESISPDR